MVKKLLPFLFVLCFFQMHAQEDLKEDFFLELDSLKKSDSFKSYFEKLAEYSSYTKKKFGPRSTQRFEETLAAYDRFGIYRRPSNTKEYLQVRKYYGSKLYSMRILNGLNKSWLDTALVAHHFAEDSIFLDEHAWHIENWIGHFYATKDDHDKALSYYNILLPSLQKEKNYNRLARTYTSISDLHNWLEEFEDAQINAEAALEIAKSENDTIALMASYSSLSQIALNLGQNDSHNFYYQGLLKLLNSSFSDDNKKERLYEAYVFRSEFHFKNGQYSQALSHLALAENQIDNLYQYQHRRRAAKIKLREVEIHMANSRWTETLASIAEGYKLLMPKHSGQDEFPKKEDLLAENTLVEFLQHHSKLIRGKNSESINKKIHCLLLALKSNSMLREEMILSSSKANSTRTNRQIIEEIIKHQHDLYLVDKKSFVFEQVQKLLHEAKNALMNERLNMNLKLSNASITVKNRVKQIQQNIRNLNTNRSSNRDSIRSLILSDTEEIYRILNLPKLDAVILPHSSSNYIEYFIGKQEVYLISQINRQQKFFNLGATDSIFQNIELLSKEMASLKRSIKTVDQILDNLSKQLLPKELVLPEKFVLVLDGNLATIPFDILRRENKYLIESHVIELQLDHHQRNIERKRNANKILCLAPNYSENIFPSLERSKPYHLPFAKSEIKMVGHHFENKVIDSTMDIQRLDETLNNCDIFHFAGHAVANSEEPFLYLNGDSKLAKWEAKEIMATNKNLQLATLSACETGLGKLQEGDGIQSLARSFLSSGTQTVIYSLWNVNDQSTVQFMQQLYGYLRDGSSITEALRLTKLNFLHHTVREFRHPYYWAGFTARGNLQPIIFRSTKPHGQFKLIVLALLGFCMAYFLFYRIKTKS